MTHHTPEQQAILDEARDRYRHAKHDTSAVQAHQTSSSLTPTPTTQLTPQALRALSKQVVDGVTEAET